ncbi:tetratricopeptide repeat protein [Geobacter sp. AOG1]|uniref:tetratricopeptide repeat protein n=1 Tax=Geobacter sp. AOG1 TaxID=1566346 RepID=UPI001CC4977C|nr:tetratricopeptide repeat protein [Geobacter sp. AOG1]GFE58344.1 hypothetical protein AOG1_22240 [Geobacter sp. AOG1]
MSTAKEKYLASAQKFIAKGQIDRAIKDYEQVVVLDPNDIRHRQRLAELLVKINRKDEAVAEYKAIGKYYSDNTYFLKAIAVYKQIQKLTPADIDISLALATLNEKQGLTGNALTEYGIVLNHYQRAGRLNDALGVLESMLNLDPENLTTQLQFAELHFSAGQTDKAYQEFTQLALLLWKQGNHEAFSQVCTRIQVLFPEQKEFQLDFIATLLDKGETAGVIPQLQQFIRTDVANLRAWRLLADVCRRLGETEKLKGVLQQIIKLFPGETSLREDLVMLYLNAGNIPGALEFLSGSVLAFVAAGEAGRMEALYAEIEKLLPKDKRVFDGLRALYEAAGDKGKLTALAARMAPPPAPQTSPAVSRETTEKALTSRKGVADEKPRMATVSVPTTSEVTDWEEEIDLPLPDDVVEPVGGSEELEPELDSELPTQDLPVEIPPFVDSGIVADAAVVPVAEIDEIEELELEPEVELMEEAPEEILEEILEAEPDDEELEELSAPLADETLEPEDLLEEDLEEEFPADLELRAEPLDEPEIVTGELFVPDYGEMGELFTEGETADDELEELQLEPVVDDAAAPSEEAGWVVAETLAEDSEPLPAEDGTVALVLNIDSENDWLTREGIAGEVVEEVIASGETGVELDELATVLGEGAGEGTEALTGFWGDDVDLSTLGEELFADGGTDAGADTGSSDKYSLDGLFSAFKKGLDQQVESGDTETHFNLGIAYKEMGLYDDAIGEFEQASHDPQRIADSLTLQAMCYREKGDAVKAEELLRNGVALKSLRKGEIQSLTYELAHLLETTGRPTEALPYYLEVRSIGRGFRDTSARIAALGGEDSEFQGLSIFDFEDD